MNMLATQFSVMFCFFDTLLLAIIVKNVWIKAFAVLFIFGGLECALVITNFDLKFMGKTTLAALSISIVYAAILIPLFCQVCNLIMN